MRVNDLGTPKKLFFVSLALLLALMYLGSDRQEQDVAMSGVVVGIQEQDGVVRGLAVDTQGQRVVVRVTGEYLEKAPSPPLVQYQEVDLKVKSFRAVKRGVSCELVQIVKAGEVRPPSEQADGSAPQKDAALPVDDLKSSFGFQGM